MKINKGRLNPENEANTKRQVKKMKITAVVAVMAIAVAGAATSVTGCGNGKDRNVAISAADYLEEAETPRWYFEGQRRMRDAGIEAHFTLLIPDDLEIKELEFFYTAESGRRRPPGIQSENQNAVYHKKVTADTRKLVVYSGRSARLEVWAVAKTRGMTYITQTSLNVYGQSGLDISDFEKPDEPQFLPGFGMNRGQGAYSVTTGTPVSFSVKSGPAVPVRVYMDGEKIAELQPEDGVYNYVLPRARRLVSPSRGGYHDLLFVADAFETDGYTGSARFSCYLPLYRSANDNLDFPAGLAALFSAAVVSLFAVVLKGRSFAWR